MARFKISESNLNEFFGIFKSKKPKDRKAIEKLIALHPGLNAISKEITRLNNKAFKDIENSPKAQAFLKKHNIDIVKDFS